MKIVRFRNEDSISYGAIEGDRVQPFSGTPFGLPPAAEFAPSGQPVPLKNVKLLAPCQPSKVVCLGLNYKPHGDELKMKLPDLPLLFLKPSTSVIGPDENIVLPPGSERIDYECVILAPPAPRPAPLPLVGPVASATVL